MNFFRKQKLTILWVGISILLIGFCCFIDNNKITEAQTSAIFYETFPNSDGDWNGSSDTTQSAPGWVVYQDNSDSDSISVENYDVAGGSLPPSGGNHLVFNDCDYGFRSPENYAIAYVSIDLSAYQDVIIEYYWQSDDVDSEEGLRAAYSINSTDGKNGTWTAIASHIDPTDDRWYLQTFSLPDVACVSNFKLRFSSESSLTSENMYVDDVKLTGAPKVAPAQISVTPASLNLGSVEIGMSSYLDFTIQNTGGENLSGSLTGLASPFLCKSGCTYNLSGGASQTATIQFSPTSAGSFSDSADFSGGVGVSKGVSGIGVAVSTCQNHNVWGWAWAGAPQSVPPERLGLGWNSFSCKNQSTAIDYGVDIEAAGNLIGYAYYDMNDPNTGTNEVGWINFDPSLVGVPGAPNRTARVDLDGSVCGSVGCVYGWARAVGYGGGWDGWIKLRKDPADSGVNYGVYIDEDDGEFHGWAWGGDVMGWISFNCDNMGTSCGVTNDYKVQTSFIFPSTAPIINDFKRDSINYCTSVQKKGHADFSWLYIGDNPQEEYKIAISTNSGFSGAQEITVAQSVSSGSRGTSGVDVVPSPTAGQLEIGYNNTYYFRVKVKDIKNTWSKDWSGTVSFSTPLHAFPWPDFNWRPESPAIKETVNTSNLSKCYNSSNNETACTSWLWIIPGTAIFVDGFNSRDFEPNIQFFTAGDNLVTLEAADSIGVCGRTKDMSMKLPMPWWFEIAPQ